MDDLSYEDIDQLEDIGDILDVSTRYGVPLEGCQNVEGFKERIILHKNKLANINGYLLEPSVNDAKRADELQKRTSLAQVFTSVRTCLQHHERLFTRVLQSQSTSDNLLQDFTDQIQTLTDNETTILVAGQTSAGKSTLLNLLLGMKVLPKSILSCTSRICKLRYDPGFKVIVVVDGQTVERRFGNEREMATCLEGLLTDRSFFDGDGILEVEIFLPAVILKRGVTIVDTPGFGESEALDDVVRGFASSGHMAGFLYIIKTDSPSRIQEDMLARFLNVLQNQMNSEAALFVCNRWDLVDVSQQEKVKATLFNKLSDFWSEFKQEQTCFISTKHAQEQMDVDKEYITYDLRILLDSLNDLFDHCEQATLKRSYTWLKRVLKESINALRAVLSQAKLDDVEYHDRYEKAVSHLDALKSKSDNIVEDLLHEMHDSIKSVKILMADLMSSAEFREMLFDWKFCEINAVPDAIRVDEMDDVNVMMDSTIVRRILRIFDEEFLTNILDIQSNMSKKVEGSLCLLEEDVSLSRSIVSFQSLQSSGSSSSTRSGSSTEDEIIAVLKHRRDSKGGLKRFGSLENLLAEPKSKPRGLISRAIAPLVGRAIRKRRKEKRRGSKTTTDTLLRERGEEVLSALKEDDSLLDLVAEKYTSILQAQIDSIACSIPMFVASTETLLGEIMDRRKDAQESAAEMQTTLNQLQSQMDLLKKFL